VIPAYYGMRNLQTHHSMMDMLEKGAHSVKSGYEGFRATFKKKPSPRPLVREHSNGQATNVMGAGSRPRPRAALADADRSKRMTHPPSGVRRSSSEDDYLSNGASVERRAAAAPAGGALRRVQTEDMMLRAHTPPPQTRAAGQRFGSISSPLAAPRTHRHKHDQTGSEADVRAERNEHGAHRHGAVNTWLAEQGAQGGRDLRIDTGPAVDSRRQQGGGGGGERAGAFEPPRPETSHDAQAHARAHKPGLLNYSRESMSGLAMRMRGRGALNDSQDSTSLPSNFAQTIALEADRKTCNYPNCNKRFSEIAVVRKLQRYHCKKCDRYFCDAHKSKSHHGCPSLPGVRRSAPFNGETTSGAASWRASEWETAADSPFLDSIAHE